MEILELEPPVEDMLLQHVRLNPSALKPAINAELYAGPALDESQLR